MFCVEQGSHVVTMEEEAVDNKQGQGEGYWPPVTITVGEEAAHVDC